MGSVRLGTFSFSPQAVAKMGYDEFNEKFGNAVPIAKYGVRRAFDKIVENVKKDETEKSKEKDNKGGQRIKRKQKEKSAATTNLGEA